MSSENNTPEPAKKSHKLRNITLWVVGTFVALAVIGSFIPDEETAPADAKSSQSSSDKAKTDGKKSEKKSESKQEEKSKDEQSEDAKESDAFEPDQDAFLDALEQQAENSEDEGYHDGGFDYHPDEHDELVTAMGMETCERIVGKDEDAQERAATRYADQNGFSITQVVELMVAAEGTLCAEAA